MAFYLIDRFVTNVSLDIDRLKILRDVFFERKAQLVTHFNNKEDEVFVTFTIRFDEKGYKTFSFSEFESYYEQAINIERIIFSLETTASLKTNKSTGEYIDLCLDVKENSRCILVSSSENKDWCENSFNTINNILLKYKTKYSFLRTDFTPLVIQLSGVIIGYLLCISLAYKTYTKFHTENSFILIFFFIFLILSNLWTYLNKYILNFFDKVIPNIEVYRENKNKVHWLLQTIIGSSVIGIIWFFLVKSSNYFFDLFQNLTKY
jgi:hypothetical protein